MAHSSTEGGEGQDVGGTVIRNNWKWYFSTGVDPKDLEKAEKMKKQDKKIPHDLHTKTIEHIGGGFIVHKKWWNRLKDVRPINGRMMEVVLETTPETIMNIVDAPHAYKNEDEKDEFYEELHRQDAVRKSKNLNIWLGDFNARPGKPREEGEEEIIGAHPYERKWNPIEVESEEVADNRNKCMDFCRIHDLRIMNTRFEKSDWNKITYRPPGT